MKNNAMNHWDKISLENLLFYTACKNGETIYARGGMLWASENGKANLLLQELLAVYNRFFKRENRKFLQKEELLAYNQACSFWNGFLKDQKRNPLFPGCKLYLNDTNKTEVT
ncbi:MAG: hypothetical protein IKJ44_01855 [Elusimicrobiaceae bacterium]|nr:hypothetical protein [Elusimicrobiaceae bacterium]